MNIRQMSKSDWVQFFRRHPEAVSQIALIEDRIARGLHLATWELNCLKAYRELMAPRKKKSSPQWEELKH